MGQQRVNLNWTQFPQKLIPQETPELGWLFRGLWSRSKSPDRVRMPPRRGDLAHPAPTEGPSQKPLRSASLPSLAPFPWAPSSSAPLELGPCRTCPLLRDVAPGTAQTPANRGSFFHPPSPCLDRVLPSARPALPGLHSSFISASRCSCCLPLPQRPEGLLPETLTPSSSVDPPPLHLPQSPPISVLPPQGLLPSPPSEAPIPPPLCPLSQPEVRGGWLAALDQQPGKWVTALSVLKFEKTTVG